MRARSVAVLVLLAAVQFASGAFAQLHPTLSLMQKAPLVIRGRGFPPSERVRVVVEVPRTTVRATRANGAGSFTIRFPDLAVPRCGGIFATARGITGGLAVLKIPLPACQPAARP